MMTTGLQVALLGGALVGLGVACLMWRLVPAEPDLADVVHRYSASGARQRSGQRAMAATTSKEQLGVWAIKRLPPSWWGATPTKELALLGIPVHRHYGKKVEQAIIGLLIPPLLTFVFSVMHVPVPGRIFVSTGGALALSGLLFMAPDWDVRKEAARARVNFTRALIAYVELVALERIKGSGPRPAMEVAAGIGDSWVFQRIGEELARSRWAGLAPWDALQNLSEELGLPDLEEVANILRNTEDGDAVYKHLRARSESMRSALLNGELAQANAASDRMDMPMAMLGMVFMLIVITPSLLRVTTGT